MHYMHGLHAKKKKKLYALHAWTSHPKSYMNHQSNMPFTDYKH